MNTPLSEKDLREELNRLFISGEIKWNGNPDNDVSFERLLTFILKDRENLLLGIRERIESYRGGENDNDELVDSLLETLSKQSD